MGTTTLIIATSRAATGTPIPMPICALRLMPDFEAPSSSWLTLLLCGEKLGVWTVGEDIGDVADVVDSEVETALLIEGAVDCISLLKTGSPDAFGVRVDPKVTVVVHFPTRLSDTRTARP